MEELKFEEALNKLEKIVNRLEEEELPLDEMIKLFEEGMKLSKYCNEKLLAAQKKIEILTTTEEGKVSTKEFDIEENKE